MSSARTRKPWSLAARLTVGFAAAAFVLILLATGALNWALRHQLQEEQDAILSDKAELLADLLRQPDADERTLRHEIEWSWSVTRRARIAMRISDDHGRVFLESPEMHRVLPQALFPAPGAGTAVVQAGDGAAFRVLTAQAKSADGQPRLLQLALDRSEDDEMMGEFRTVLWIILAIAPLASAAIGYHVAWRGLKPLADVSATAAKITASTLGQRMETAAMPAELAELTRTFNAMLERLESAFGRVSLFSADIAHELRTPLHVLRGETEVALAKARSPEEYRHILGSALEEYGRLGKLIETLLFLARADNPETQIEREPIDVSQNLQATVDFYEPMAAEAGVHLTADVKPGVTARLDRTLLLRALGNLVANAIAHTPPGGTVVLRARPQGGQIEIEVEDTGRGIAPEHLPYVFDRFYRGDNARSAAGGHIGLGLALVKSIAVLHGGAVEVHSEFGRGSRFRMTLPTG